MKATVPIVGWTTCLTYETRERLGYDHFDELLDEMSRHGMSRLTVMTATHYHFDQVNHGIAWPVSHAELEPMVDRQAINANPDTEFFSRVIEKAHRLGIEVIFEVKYAGMAGIRTTYPDIRVWTRPDGSSYAARSENLTEIERERLEIGHICHDDETAQRFMRDQIDDLLGRYPDVDGVVMEWPGYGSDGCHCAGTTARFEAETGQRYGESPERERLDWQNHRVAQVLSELGELVRRGGKHRLFALYTGFSPADCNIARSQEFRGHRRDTLTQANLDYLMPYCEGRHREHEEREIERVIAYLDPFPCYVHCTIRRKPPGNYPLPPKDPAYIHRMIKWAFDYWKNHPDRVIGLTFFNETNIPEENRQAVYDALDVNLPPRARR